MIDFVNLNDRQLKKWLYDNLVVKQDPTVFPKSIPNQMKIEWARIIDYLYSTEYQGLLYTILRRNEKAELQRIRDTFAVCTGPKDEAQEFIRNYHYNYDGETDYGWSDDTDSETDETNNESKTYHPIPEYKITYDKIVYRQTDGYRRVSRVKL